MLFSEILENIPIRNYPVSLNNIDVKDIKIDSRLVEEGDLFIALKGETFDGNDFIDNALQRGASIIMTDQFKHGEKIVNVDNARKAYALACKNYFKKACDNFKIIAVTGTNGKTTTCNTIKDLLQFSGAKVGIIGTLGAEFNKEKIDTGLTTPDPYILHKLFLDMKNQGVEFVVMEASAHALALDKLEGINFEIGVLTNITQDHLDFFKTMESYAEAKYKLFEKGKVKLGIIGLEDEFCKKLFLNPKVPIITYGLNNGADIFAYQMVKNFDGSSFVCDYMGEKTLYKSNLVGEYNIKNALASIAVCRSLGIPSEMIKLGLSCCKPVEGRFNIIRAGNLNIIIDFAHTPDGLQNVLKTAKGLSDKELIVIFGCGGNRDNKKRPIMGKIAETYADKVILTSDNPRFENPIKIIKNIKSGMKKNPICIENRKKAIEYVLENYKDGQTVVIAGKGAEKYQEIDGIKNPYNDYDVVYNFYRKKLKKISQEDGQDKKDLE